MTFTDIKYDVYETLWEPYESPIYEHRLSTDDIQVALSYVEVWKSTLKNGYKFIIEVDHAILG